MTRILRKVVNINAVLKRLRMHGHFKNLVAYAQAVRSKMFQLSKKLTNK